MVPQESEYIIASQRVSPSPCCACGGLGDVLKCSGHIHHRTTEAVLISPESSPSVLIELCQLSSVNDQLNPS
ncbi:MAG: hypothetical protein AAFO06_09800 [Cyanobacteria bacterium J06597_16]